MPSKAFGGDQLAVREHGFARIYRGLWAELRGFVLLMTMGEATEKPCFRARLLGRRQIKRL